MTDTDWLATLPMMSVAELEAAEGMLRARTRHPAVKNNATAMLRAGERLADIAAEYRRRFATLVS